MKPNPKRSLAVQPFSVEPEALYPIDLAARLAQVPRHFLLVCCRRGLIIPHLDEAYGGFYFNGSDVRRLQRIAYLYGSRGVNLAGIEIILELFDRAQNQAEDR